MFWLHYLFLGSLILNAFLFFCSKMMVLMNVYALHTLLLINGVEIINYWHFSISIHHQKHSSFIRHHRASIHIWKIEMPINIQLFTFTSLFNSSDEWLFLLICHIHVDKYGVINLLKIKKPILRDITTESKKRGCSLTQVFFLQTIVVNPTQDTHSQYFLHAFSSSSFLLITMFRCHSN